MKESFVFRLFRADKILFGALVIYVLGLLCGWRLDREEFPFLLYGMYSLKEKPSDTYNLNLIKCNDESIITSDLSSPRRELLTGAINHGASLTDRSLQTWLQRYSGCESVKVFKTETGYDAAGKLIHYAE